MPSPLAVAISAFVLLPVREFDLPVTGIPVN